MIIDGVYGFDPKRYKIHYLISQARRRGITISPKGKIIVRRMGWTKGIQSLERIPTMYLTFHEALRSLRHTLTGIFGRLAWLRKVRTELRSFQDWLAEKHLDPEVKKEDAKSRVCDFLFQLSGVRCENLVELKEHFAGDEPLTKSLEELLEDKNWGAACGKIVFTLVRRLGNEHKRLCVQIPRIAEKEQLLGKIWEHDLWFVRLVRQRAVSFGQLFDRAKAGSSNLLPVIAELNLLTGSFGSPFYHRLIWAKQAFEGLERVFWAASGISEKARGQLRKGLWFLKAHEEWLLKADSYLESKKPPQEMPVLKEAVR